MNLLKNSLHPTKNIYEFFNHITNCQIGFSSDLWGQSEELQNPYYEDQRLSIYKIGN